jgi:hypothetical protein
MGKITFESDDPSAVDAFEDFMEEAMMNCRMREFSGCDLEGTLECDRCPFSGELRSKKRKRP